jgi:Flp pilus assembly protein TadG
VRSSRVFRSNSASNKARLRRVTSARGASAVEFALVAPVVLLMLLFMIDAGRALFVMANLQNAAHQGALVASLGGSEAESEAVSIDLASEGQQIASSDTLTASLSEECPEEFDPENPSWATMEVTVDFEFFTPIDLLQFFDSERSRPNSVLLTEEAQWLCGG